MMQDLKTGSLLRQLRREKGWTQRQVAERLGVSAQAVSKWERDLSGSWAARTWGCSPASQRSLAWGQTRCWRAAWPPPRRTEET